MFFGIAIGRQLEFQAADQQNTPSGDTHNIIALVPVVAGAVLTLVGGARMSMLLRPSYLLLLGAALIVGALLGPRLTAQMFPKTKNYNWTWTSLMLLFVFRTVGIIFFSTGLLRLFWRGKDEA
jgi:uncharacterized metal-binding protein